MTSQQSRELRLLSDGDLLDLYEDKKESMYRMRLQSANGDLKDPKMFMKTRREIARILTIIHERELATRVAGEKK